MLTYEMPKPSDNMQKSYSELAEMEQEWQKTLSDREDQYQALYEAAADRNEYNHARESRDIAIEQRNQQASRRAYFNNFKSSLLAECMVSLFRHSAVGPLTSKDNVTVRNMVNNFIKENGVNDLLSNFRTKNLVLAEYANLVDKYFNLALNEETKQEDPGEDRPAIGLEPKECNFNVTLANDFFEDLADVDDETVSKMIKERVADSINDFIDDNAEARMEYKDIIQGAQDKIDSTKDITEESANAYMAQAKRKINEARMNRPHNVFHYLVEAMTKHILKDDDLKKIYVKESKVNMDEIVNSAALIYTMLEMVNTTSMANADEDYIKSYITALNS